MVAMLDVIIANSPGQSVNVPFKDTQPIFFVLERVRAQLGTKEEDIDRQDLFINGRLLKDQQQTLAHYRIFGRTLTYRARLKNEMNVNFKGLDGRSLSMVCHPEMRIEEVKELHYRKSGIPVDQLRYIFGGKQLQNKVTLREYNIEKDSIVHVVLRLRGGGAPGITFSDVSDTSGVRKVQFSYNAPRGRFASPGTNVECNCACTPTHQVISQKSYGTLELSEATFMCPNCHKSDRIVPVTVGFMQCKYRFHGIKATGEQYTSDWKEVAADDCYQLFSADKQTTWRRLVIETKDLYECEECTICLEQLRSVETLGCGHQFHSDCIAGWNGSCPNCRFNQHLTTGRSAESA